MTSAPKFATLLAACAALLVTAACAQDAPPPPSGVHYITLIRHGDYDPEHGDVDERTHDCLNARGREQAKLAGERLAKFPVKIRMLVCSDFCRARETAEIIGKVLHETPVPDSLIHECTPQADRADYMRRQTPPEVALCDSNLAAAWRKYAAPTPDADVHDVLVCHGNVTRWFTVHALGADLTHWTRMDIANGSLTTIAIRADGSSRLVGFSDIGHVPVPQQTWTGRGMGLMPPKPAPAPAPAPSHP